jgi:threonine dehydrogenase-like Zn-dependent dehydrogenase
MRALVYGEPPARRPVVPAGVDEAVVARLLDQPVGLRDVPEPAPAGPAHVVCAPRLAGVCGSDARLLLGNLSEGDLDNPMAAFSVLPFVPGHEVVADVVSAGPDAGLVAGQRVVLDPWLGCAPRGRPLCAACAAGDHSQCERFLDEGRGPGLHTGVTTWAPGAFAERFAVHASQLHPVPDGVDDRAAVLADPFSVSLHAVARTPPPPRGRVLVIGAGALGTTCVAALRRLHPDVGVAVLYRYAHQRDAARRLGAHLVVDHEPRESALAAVCSFSDGTPRPALQGLSMSYPGGVDVVYDTVGSAESLELAVRATRMRGAVVLLGVATPRRFEWTPIYFKELTVSGSSGFGHETVGGARRHAIDHYLAACEDGLDLAWLVTHVAPLDDWVSIGAALAAPGESRVLKAAFAPASVVPHAEER